MSSVEGSAVERSPIERSLQLEWVSPVTPALDADMRDRGRHMARLLHQMRVSLPLRPDVLATTAEITVRPFRPGTDDDAWIGVNNRAFRWHPDQGGWDPKRLRERMHELVPVLFRAASAGDPLALTLVQQQADERETP